MSSASNPSFRIYPSLLNKFDDYVNAEVLWNDFYGSSDDPAITLEQYEEKMEQELIDAVNRVPFISEAASRGTALNALVDCIIEDRHPNEKEPIVVVIPDKGLNEPLALEAHLDGFTFPFDYGLCTEIADYFKGAICQYLCKANLDTAFGVVELYGYADYILRNKVFDLKTTSKYSFGKYERGYQKDLYPYCLIESGEMDSVESFEYTVYQLSGGNSRTPFIQGTQYKEEYTYNHETSKKRLCDGCEGLIAFLLSNQDKITNKRIFYQD